MVDVHDELIQPLVASLFIHSLLATLITLYQECIGLFSMIPRVADSIMKHSRDHGEELVERDAKLGFRVDSGKSQ